MIYFRGMAVIRIPPIISIILIMLSGCSVSPDFAQMGLKKNGKLYMFSNVSYDTITKAIPMGFILIYKDNGKYFVEPSHTILGAKPIVESMGGDITLHEFKEPSHDGYYSTGVKNTLYREESATKSTEIIGEQLRTTHITLTNEEGTHMNISWQWNTKTNETTPLENCELRSFWSRTSVQPGTTSIWRNEMLVVSLGQLAAFYSCSISYNQKERVLLIDVD